MLLVAVFDAVLPVAVLLSDLAARFVLSTSLLFLLGGALVSDGFLGLIHITPGSEIVSVTADLALFAVLACVSPEFKGAFEPRGEALAEPAKFAALLVFGALLTRSLFGDLPVGGYVAVVLAIVLIRPASLLISLLGTKTINRREKLTAEWFGPKGFASVVDEKHADRLCQALVGRSMTACPRNGRFRRSLTPRRHGAGGGGPDGP